MGWAQGTRRRAWRRRIMRMVKDWARRHLYRQVRVFSAQPDNTPSSFVFPARRKNSQRSSMILLMTRLVYIEIISPIFEQCHKPVRFRLLIIHKQACGVASWKILSQWGTSQVWCDVRKQLGPNGSHSNLTFGLDRPLHPKCAWTSSLFRDDSMT